MRIVHDSGAACHVPDAVDGHHFGTGLVWDGVGPRRLICGCLSGFFVPRPVTSQSRWIGFNLAACLGDEIFLGTDAGTSWKTSRIFWGQASLFVGCLQHVGAPLTTPRVDVIPRFVDKDVSDRFACLSRSVLSVEHRQDLSPACPLSEMAVRTVTEVSGGAALGGAWGSCKPWSLGEFEVPWTSGVFSGPGGAKAWW